MSELSFDVSHKIPSNSRVFFEFLIFNFWLNISIWRGFLSFLSFYPHQPNRLPLVSHYSLSCLFFFFSLCFSSCAPSFSLLFSQLHYLSSSSSLAAAALSVSVLQERKRFSSENCTGSWRITGVSGDWKPLSLNYILLIGELEKLNGKGSFFLLFSLWFWWFILDQRVLCTVANSID